MGRKFGGGGLRPLFGEEGAVSPSSTKSPAGPRPSEWHLDPCCYLAAADMD